MKLFALCRQLVCTSLSSRLGGVGGCHHSRAISSLMLQSNKVGQQRQVKLFEKRPPILFPRSLLSIRTLYTKDYPTSSSLLSSLKITKTTVQLVKQYQLQQIRLKHTQFQAHPSQLKRRSLRVERTKLPEHYNMEWPKITLFGDSITRRSFDVENGCWASMLAYKVNSFFDVDPRGFEGYNSKWALQLMPELFPKSYLDKVEIFVLFFGHNDSWETAPLHVPLDQYNSNMRLIVKYLLDHGVARNKIVLITPSWFYLPTFKEYTKSLGMPEVKKEMADCEKYSETVKRIGADEQLEVLDFFAVTAKYQPLEELFCDGVHFSRTGAKLLYDHLMPVLEKKIELAFKKPLADLWHAVPFDQHPELVPVMEAWKQKMAEEAAAAAKK